MRIPIVSLLVCLSWAVDAAVADSNIGGLTPAAVVPPLTPDCTTAATQLVMDFWQQNQPGYYVPVMWISLGFLLGLVASFLSGLTRELQLRLLNTPGSRVPQSDFPSAKCVSPMSATSEPGAPSPSTSSRVLTPGASLEVEGLPESCISTADGYVRALVEASRDPLTVISPEGNVTDVNITAENVAGIARSKLIGADFATYYTNPKKLVRRFVKPSRLASCEIFHFRFVVRTGISLMCCTPLQHSRTSTVSSKEYWLLYGMCARATEKLSNKSSAPTRAR